MNTDQGAPLLGCTAWISPVYLPDIQDVTMGGVFYISYEPYSESNIELPDYQRARLEIYAYEADAGILHWLNNLVGVHRAEVDKEQFGMIKVDLRTLITQDPRQRRRIWDKTRAFLISLGAEIAPYCRFDVDEFADAYAAWLETLK